MLCSEDVLTFGQNLVTLLKLAESQSIALQIWSNLGEIGVWLECLNNCGVLACVLKPRTWRRCRDIWNFCFFFCGGSQEKALSHVIEAEHAID